MVKQLLKRTLHFQKLTLAEIENITYDIEAVINSRPLTYLNTEDGELESFTPAYFLSDLPTTALPELEVLNANELTKRFGLLC